LTYDEDDDNRWMLRGIRHDYDDRWLRGIRYDDDRLGRRKSVREREREDAHNYTASDINYCIISSHHLCCNVGRGDMFPRLH
jgi:hypothetical protein